VKLEEVETFIKNLQNEQAPGEDIKSELYKYALKKFKGTLLIFQSLAASLRTTRFNIQKFYMVLALL